MNSRLLRLLALLFAFSLIAAACADDSDDDGAADDAPAPTAADDDMADDSSDDMADDDMADDAADDMADDDMADDDMADDEMADDSDDMADDDMAAIDRTGEVIKIGYVNNEGAAFSLPEFRTGGEVAIQFINDNGGINGAMIETEVCLSDGTPESAINCANQLIEADVVLAYMGIEVASEAAINLWVEAGIPLHLVARVGSHRAEQPRLGHPALARRCLCSRPGQDICRSRHQPHRRDHGRNTGWLGIHRRDRRPGARAPRDRVRARRGRPRCPRLDSSGRHSAGSRR